MKKFAVCGLTLLLIASVFMVSCSKDETQETIRKDLITTYPTNDSGLTYGPDIKENTDLKKEPDLIQVCNEDGLVGYIYASDIKDGAESLEEAINWEPRTYKVPMYLEDGETVIGEFTISIGSISAAISPSCSLKIKLFISIALP